MKHLLSLCLLILSHTIFAQTWHEIPSGTDHKLNSIHFVDANIGFIAGDDSLFLKTIDGGKSWSRLPVNIASNLSIDLKDVWFEDEQQGYLLVGQYSGFYFTIDGGITWQLDSSLNNTNMCFKRSMYFTAMDEGYVGGSMCFQGETIAKRTSGAWGVPNAVGSWNADDQITNFDFLNNQKGFATSTSNSIFKTVDAGTTWDSVHSSIDSLGTSDVVFMNDTLAYATFPNFGSSGILITTDGGNSWAADWSAATFFYPGFNAATKNAYGTAYFGGVAGWAQNGLIFTKGKNSFWIYDQVDHAINDLAVSYDSVVFAVGDSGLIVTNTNPQVIGIIEDEVIEISVFPNPVLDFVTVKTQQTGTISVINIIGEVVAEFDKESESLEIDFSDYKAGVYLLRYDVKQESVMVKLIKQVN